MTLPFILLSLLCDYHHAFDHSRLLPALSASLTAWLCIRLTELWLARPPPPISATNVQSSPPRLFIPESDLQCPCCLTVPRSSPVPSCPLGHIVCTSCYNSLPSNECPTCRTEMRDNNFSIAGTTSS